MKKQLCLCGCGETFTQGKNRKFATPACALREKYKQRAEARAEVGRKKAEMLRVCKCGCKKQFPQGRNGRQYYSNACRSRVALAKKNSKSRDAVKTQKCKICGTNFTPQNQRHVTCSKTCGVAAKKQKDELRYKNRVPATHKQGSALWDGIKTDEDFTHKKYLEYKKQMKKLNGRVCMAEGCEAGCIGFNYFCEFHQEQNYRKAAACGFLEEGGSRQSAHMIFGG